MSKDTLFPNKVDLNYKLLFPGNSIGTKLFPLAIYWIKKKKKKKKKNAKKREMQSFPITLQKAENLFNVHTLTKKDVFICQVMHVIAT